MKSDFLESESAGVAGASGLGSSCGISNNKCEDPGERH